MPPTLAVCGVTWSGQGIGRVLTYDRRPATWPATLDNATVCTGCGNIINVAMLVAQMRGQLA